MLALCLVERRELRPVHELEPLRDRGARQPDAGLELCRFALVGVERTPKRQPGLAGLGARLDLRADARRSVGVDVAHRRLHGGERKTVVGGGDAQGHQIREALEDGADGVARALGDACRGRDLRVLAQQREIGLDDQLARAFAAQSPAIDDGSRRRCTNAAHAGVAGSRRS